jgi:redox-sensitive bicupin YhaK (pirin superfamily)
VQHWDLANDRIDPHHPLVLDSEDGVGRTVALHLPAGERLQEHETHERTWVAVLDGEVDVVQNGQTVTGGTGFVARFDPGERREIAARRDTRLLLVLLPWPGAGHPNLSAAGRA